MKRYLLLLLCAGLIGSGSFLACHRTRSESGLVIRLAMDPATLDWNRAHTPIETHVILNLMEGLVELDQQLKVQPALAEHWKVSPDGKKITFHLRPGVKWSDGVPLRAQDFVDSWKRLLTRSTAAPYAHLLFDIEGAHEFYLSQGNDFSKVGVKAVDDSTLEVKLVHSVSNWIQRTSFWVSFPVRSDIIKKHGTQWELPGKMVSLGPYLLASRRMGSEIVLEANPNYYGVRGNIKKVVARVIEDNTTALRLYESHQLDLATDLSAMQLKEMRDRKDFHEFPYLKTVYLGLLDQGPLANLALRRSIARVINKQALAGLLQGGQVPATTFVPPGLIGYSKQLGTGELEKSVLTPPKKENPIALEMVYPARESNHLIAQWLQAELKKALGIELSLQSYDLKTYHAQVNQKKIPMFLLSWAADFPDPDNFVSVFLSDSGNNRTLWKSPGFDKSVTEARYLTNPTQREKIYLQVQQDLIEKNAVIIPLFYEPIQVLIQPRVHGIEITPVNGLYLRKANLGDANSQ